MVLEDLVSMVLKGLSKVEGQITIDGKQYEVKCYSGGAIIRVDLKPIV